MFTFRDKLEDELKYENLSIKCAKIEIEGHVYMLLGTSHSSDELNKFMNALNTCQMSLGEGDEYNELEVDGTIWVDDPNKWIDVSSDKYGLSLSIMTMPKEPKNTRSAIFGKRSSYENHINLN